MFPKGDTSRGDLRPHIGVVFYGTLALGFGSALLLIGPVVWLLGGGTAAFDLRIPAVVVHFVAWMLLLASVRAFPPASDLALRRLADGMVVLWVLWFVAALVGIGTLPLAFPALYCTIICLPEGLQLLLYFPFVPSVFAPVVVGHAAFLRLESRLLGPLSARTVMRAARVLAGFAVASIAIQAAGQFSRWAYLLAGLTAPGYFLAAIGLGRAWREGSSFNGLSLGAARRSAGL